MYEFAIIAQAGLCANKGLSWFCPILTDSLSYKNYYFNQVLM